jgi:prephenate dehydrogenase
LALRASGFRGSIVGWNRSAEGAQQALTMGAIDSIAADPLQAARESQVVLLAVPIYATLDFMEKLALASSAPNTWSPTWAAPRRSSLKPAARLFNSPDRAAFLPGHPMAGKERGGAALADAALFRGAVWLFTDDPLPALTAFGRTGQRLARSGRSHGLEDRRSRPRAPR